MTGEEQQRIGDEPGRLITSYVNLGTWDAAAKYGTVILPHKRVLAVVAVTPVIDTHCIIPLRVVSPNTLRYHARVRDDNAEPANLTPMGGAYVVCILPYE